MDKCINDFFLLGKEIKISEEFENCNSTVCKGKSQDKGKSLYEVLRISDGIPIFLFEHLKRLENSAKIMKYSLSITRDEIINGIITLINKNKVRDGNLKLVVNYIPSDNNDSNEKFLAYFVPHFYPTKEQYQQGVKTITYHGERSNPNAKVVNDDFRAKVNEKIKNENVYEAILVDNAGFITEGSKSNIFMVKGSTVVTSKVENVLPGITRQFIIKACESLKIDFEEKNIHESELESYNGLFISGTSPSVLPINKVDGISFDSAKNSIINSIMKEYDSELNENKEKFVKFTSNNTINK